MAKGIKPTIRARIIVVTPPRGVAFALQRGKAGKAEAVSAVTSKGNDLIFDFDLVVSAGTKDRDFSGPFVQGPLGTRFVYISSGTLAGQFGAVWTRRAKISLESITQALIDEARSQGAVLETRFAGTAKDGGPACATVPLLGGWRLAPR